MLDIMGKKYISQKEAVGRYGMSASWFQKARKSTTMMPPYVKLSGKGKVYYPLDEIDIWFRQNMLSKE